VRRRPTSSMRIPLSNASAEGRSAGATITTTDRFATRAKSRPIGPVPRVTMIRTYASSVGPTPAASTVRRTAAESSARETWRSR
jgi:hypothetical protein